MSVLLDVITEMDALTMTEAAWRRLAACRGLDTRLFFPEGRGPELRAREQIAKSICHECVVAQQCRATALTSPERYGIWGGLTEEERTRRPT